MRRTDPDAHPDGPLRGPRPPHRPNPLAHESSCAGRPAPSVPAENGPGTRTGPMPYPAPRAAPARRTEDARRERVLTVRKAWLLTGRSLGALRRARAGGWFLRACACGAFCRAPGWGLFVGRRLFTARRGAGTPAHARMVRRPGRRW